MDNTFNIWRNALLFTTEFRLNFSFKDFLSLYRYDVLNFL